MQIISPFSKLFRSIFGVILNSGSLTLFANVLYLIMYSIVPQGFSSSFPSIILKRVGMLLWSIFTLASSLVILVSLVEIKNEIVFLIDYLSKNADKNKTNRQIYSFNPVRFNIFNFIRSQKS